MKKALLLMMALATLSSCAAVDDMLGTAQPMPKQQVVYTEPLETVSVNDRSGQVVQKMVVPSASSASTEVQNKFVVKQVQNNLSAKNVTTNKKVKAVENKSATQQGAIKAKKSNSKSASAFSCGTKRTCGQMNSCAEARFFLNQCGVRKLDRDGDGIPCESLCGG